MTDNLCCECGASNGACKEYCPRIRHRSYQRFHKMEAKHRIVILLILVALLFVTFALMTRFAIYANTSLQISQGEMRPIAGVAEAYSDQLCSFVSIKTEAGSLFNVHVLGTAPEVGRYEKFTITKKGTMNHSEYVVWKFYLIRTSRVKVETCAENSPVEFWVIRGTRNWNKWAVTAQCSGCQNHHETYLPCDNNYQEHDFEISSTGEYYFAYVNRKQPSRLALHVTFHIERALYDIAPAHTVVYNTSSTLIPINFGDFPVVHISSDKFKDTDIVYVECLPNVLMYFVYFAFVPVGCAAVLAMFIWVLVKLHRGPVGDVYTVDSSRQYYSLRNSSTPPPGLSRARRPGDVLVCGRNLYWAPTSESFANGRSLPVRVVDLPPDYNSVTQSETELPPSYDEVQANRSNNEV